MYFVHFEHALVLYDGAPFSDEANETHRIYVYPTGQDETHTGNNTLEGIFKPLHTGYPISGLVDDYSEEDPFIVASDETYRVSLDNYF